MATETASRRPPRPTGARCLPLCGADSLVGVADHSLLIAAAIAFLAPFVFMALTSLMTTTRRCRRTSAGAV